MQRNYDKEILSVYYNDGRESKELMTMIAKNIGELVKCVEIKSHKVVDTRAMQELQKRGVKTLPVIVYKKNLYTGKSTFNVVNVCIDQYNYASNRFNLDNVDAYQRMVVAEKPGEKDEEESDTLSAAEIQKRMMMFERRREAANSKPAKPASASKSAANTKVMNDDEWLSRSGMDNVDTGYIPAPGNELEDFFNEEADRSNRAPSKRRAPRRG